MLLLPLAVAFTALMSPVSSANTECVPRRFDQDSVVCVCNSTFCDFMDTGSNVPPPSNPYLYFYYFTSSRDGERLKMKQSSFGAGTSPNKYVYYRGNDTLQSIIGFGGAFTDAATINIHSLSDGARTNLMKSYYSSMGNDYSIGRIPMASCDFSKRLYSYDDEAGDIKLTKFSLTEEDALFKIPAIKQAMSLSKRNISLFGSPWSAPGWMKTNGNMTGKGTLKGQPGGEYFKAWANYFVKFLQAYKDHGINIWGLTGQNEPTDGMITDFPFQCMGWTPELQRDFIAQDLGPALEANGFGHVKLMILDDQRVFLPYWPEVVLKDKSAAKYVSGIAVHWYEDLIVPHSALDLTYKMFGDKYFILNTEACEQDLVDKTKSVKLGSWHSAERYFYDIVEDLRHGVGGWVDWNLALDMQGGPNWQNNFADSPIIVNAEKDEFYKQPMFYAMAHFSKFIEPGSYVISFSRNFTEDIGVDVVFTAKEYDDVDKKVVANFLNRNENETVSITVFDPPNAGMINVDLPPKSFVTITWLSP